MKYLLIVLLIGFTIKSNAQSDIKMTVQEISIADTAFNVHPKSIVLQWQDLNSTLDTVLVYYEIYAEPSSIDSSVFINQNSFYRGVMKVSMSQYKAAFKNGVINYTTADAILQKLKLKSVH